MERTLAEYTAYVPLVKYIYDEMMEGRFDRLVTDGFVSRHQVPPGNLKRHCEPALDVSR
ncbi:hypothetical protein [Burkholderia ubonensis]|uniref:hypothetical protein n=1 Tax=Burkholderia ubonensis TaxID=101571 RepID=UPI000AAC18C8|nr:hypothetical protein [Burkholderia ubonensis]